MENMKRLISWTAGLCVTFSLMLSAAGYWPSIVTSRFNNFPDTSERQQSDFVVSKRGQHGGDVDEGVGSVANGDKAERRFFRLVDGGAEEEDVGDEAGARTHAQSHDDRLQATGNQTSLWSLDVFHNRIQNWDE